MASAVGRGMHGKPTVSTVPVRMCSPAAIIVAQALHRAKNRALKWIPGVLPSEGSELWIDPERTGSEAVTVLRPSYGGTLPRCEHEFIGVHPSGPG